MTCFASAPSSTGKSRSWYFAAPTSRPPARPTLALALLLPRPPARPNPRPHPAPAPARVLSAPAIALSWPLPLLLATQILDIKKAAKNGQEKSAKILAKELVRLRAQKDKLTSMHAQVGSVSVRASVRSPPAAADSVSH